MYGKYKKILTLLLAAALLPFAGAAETETRETQTMHRSLNIGWGRRSIGQEGPVPITGQFYLRISQGIYSPVLTDALVLENGDDAVIFVSADMVEIRPGLLLRVREILRREAKDIPAEKIILNATHTHAGPSYTLADYSVSEYPLKTACKPAAEMLEFLARRIADAVKDAWRTRAPGAVAYGYGFATTGHSRRVTYLKDIGDREKGKPGLAINGRAKMYGRTNDEWFDGYEAGLDSFINLLYTFDAQGKLTGAVINVPCPAQTNENVWKLHAGFWHNVREKLQAKYGPVGLVCQSAAAGDLAPRQMHCRAAELRRYKLKYPEKFAAYAASPIRYPAGTFASPEAERARYEYDTVEMMRAEDIAGRIAAAFDDVLDYARKEKFTDPPLKHEVRTVMLAKRLFPEDRYEEEKKNLANFARERFLTDGDPWTMLRENSMLACRRKRSQSVIDRYEKQKPDPMYKTEIHAVRIGNIAFAGNEFELFIDFMHRIQARSPFEQTFIVQLTGSPYGNASYLATERAVANKGYSATPYCNVVSPEGGQQLVEETLKILRDLR